jgi:predicted dienelactone hydrolase
MPLLLLLIACSPPPPAEHPDPAPAWVAPDEVGPYAAGTTTRVFTDSRGKELTIEVWYPAVDPGTDPEPYAELAFTGEAHRDAAPDLRGAPYPLVAFSHGFGGIRYQSTFLTDHLTQHGFVVVGVDHPHNTLLDLDTDLTVEVMLNRPGDVVAAVDHLLDLSAEESLLAGLVEAEDYAMMGHSFGAFTALIIGGGVIDLAYGLSYCETFSGAFCEFVDGLEVDQSQLPEADPRAQLIVPLAPGGWYAFGEDGVGLSEAVPSVVLAGDRDSDLPYTSEAKPVMDALASPHRGVTLHGAGHWGFSDLCAIVPFDDCAGAEDGFMEPERTQYITRTIVTAAVGESLTGNSDYLSWLEPEMWEEDVTLEVR